MPPTLGYRPDIDGLRAIAVLAVVLFHAGVAGFGGGFVGVDVFFVISGFLITRLIVDDPHFSLLAFYQRRAGRILPALAVVVFATCRLHFFLPRSFLRSAKASWRPRCSRRISSSGMRWAISTRRASTLHHR
jgi:peptidoglycan/LPS O-acetylase OafA/YrhL